MDAASQARLAKVHPELAKRVGSMIESLAADGRDVRAVQGLRTYAEQDALYSQGRTRKGPKVTNAKGGFSNHNFGLAADLCPFKDGKPDWNDTAGFKAIGAAAKKVGLEWGGDWTKFTDMPHVQLPGLTVKECRALYAKGGLGAVWAKIGGTTIAQTESIDIVAKPTAWPVLKRGSKGKLVVLVQQKLGIKADGDFGINTENALVKFQRANGLDADGKVGPHTRKALGL